MLSFDLKSQAVDCHKTDPIDNTERLKLAQQFQNWRQEKSPAKQQLTPYSIPLVFHVLQQSPPSPEAIDQALVAINFAFANAEQFENERGADTQLSFSRACESPDGGATSGINYINSAYQRVDMDLEHQDLVNTIKWSSDRYVNVWLVREIPGESLADYDARTWWTRLGVGGYASSDGIVVTSLDATLMAHELGHYFGLFHTWEGRDCKNDDCLMDGDMFCDTPPDKSVFNSCDDNSCSTDTLSNFSNNTFFTDTLDMGTNFMDYGNGGCQLDFSLGQAERMQFMIETNYPDLPYELRSGNACPSPCEDAASVQIEIAERYPVVGSLSFSSNHRGDLTNFAWYRSPMNYTWAGEVTGELVSTEADYTGDFDTPGYYSLFLKAWNAADSTCFASTSVNIRVTCGVVARFSPNKRFIASKQPHKLFTDSVTFFNLSVGETETEWIISHENNDPAGTDLLADTLNEAVPTYYFREPGRYRISLRASDGACEDLRGPFILPVDDPTIDGIPFISSLSCSDSETTTVQFTIFNEGYDTIRSITPVAFYDADPFTSANARFLGGGPLNNIVYGFESEDFIMTIEQDLAVLDELYLVFNATGEEELPIVFPPGDANKLSTETIFPESGFSELTYENNLSSFTFNDELTFAEEIRVCRDQWTSLLIEELVQTEICWDSVLWSSDIQGDLGFGNVLDYRTAVNDELDITLVSSSGLRESSTISVLASSPQYAVDTVFRIIRGNTVVIAFQEAGDYTYEWFPQSGLDDPFGESVVAGPLENTTYTVTITDAFGCQKEQAIQVWVETTAHIPDLFTPNNDGANDRLIIYDLLEVRDVLFRIVNKEGGLVFSSTNANELTRNGWDGSKNGQPQAAGAYFWTIEGTYEDGRPVQLNQSQSNAGIIHLVR